MNQNNLHKIIGAGVFFITALVYLLTVQPSVSFWDCGEFIASSFLLQVPHPPGTPFFLILGRLFSLIPFAENIGFRVNMISVLSSAFSVLFLYLTAVKLIINYKQREHESILDALGTYLAAAIGALSLAFSDTFWFNASEAEVYALSTFFIAFITWLIVAWNEKADEPDSEKYIVMIAYLIGLSTGVHLMAVLGIVPIVMVIMFRKYITDDKQLMYTGKLFLIHAALIIIIAVGMWYSLTDARPPDPEEYRAVDSRFLWVFIAVSALFMGVFWKKIFQRNSFYIPLIIGGIALVATYPGMVKYIPNLISSIGKNNIVLDIIIFLAIFALIGYGIYWTKQNNRQTANLILKSALFALLGFTSYAMIIIRANQDTPINLNSPKTFSEVVSYLNREQYGDFPTWKRRFSQEPHQQGIYTNYSSDLDFLVSYQIDHMFHRYLAWNYAGRESTVQDSGVDWSELYGIPLLLGLFGLYYHFRRDWKMASVFLVMFIFLGYLTAFYQNQQQPQPRERDYFYVGAFFVYSIWIALGVRGILDLLRKQLAESNLSKPIFSVVLVAAFLMVPGNMLKENYFTHDRSRNYVPWDYSYNMLQSVAQNAIIFTNGDNDTFPLWYLQDVEGVRRDVRIANLSLLNTPWYIKQLKNNEPHGTAKVPMNFSDLEIDRLGPMRWDPRNMSLPVPKNILAEYNVTDTTTISSGAMTWRMDNTVQFGSVKAIRVQDLVVLDIIQANNWNRPVYFAVTCADDSKIGLQDHLVMEGLAFRLVPNKEDSYYQSVNEPILRQQLFDEPEGYSVDYAPGFKFRGLNDKTIFFDDNHVRLTQNYRNSYMRLALHYLYEAKNNEMVVRTLDKMEENIPRDIIPIDYRLLHDIGSLYYSAGGMEQYLQVTEDVEQEAWKRIEANPNDLSNQRYSPYIILKEIYENLGQYNKLVDLFLRLKAIAPNDPNVNSLLEQYRKLAGQDTSDIIPQTMHGDLDQK